MEYEKYKIPREEKLEDLARQFGLSVEEIQALNPEMRSFKNFWGTETYVEVNQIIKVPVKTNKKSYGDSIDFDFVQSQEQRKERAEKYGKLVLNIENEKRCRYKIIIQQKLCAKDKTFVDTETEIDWLVLYQKDKENKINITVSTEQNIVKNQPPGMSKLIDFSVLFNEPTKIIQLELDEVGAISKVINQKEILQKWLQLRNEKLGEYQNDISMRGIFIAGDTEFSDTLPSLLNNPLYFLFFDKVYDKTLEKSTYYNSEKFLYSKLFQGKQIPLGNQQNFKLKEYFSIENDFFCTLKDQKEIKDFFMINYKDLVGNDWDYHYKINSSAKYHLDFGILKELKAKSTEQANENLYHETIYNIKLIN